MRRILIIDDEPDIIELIAICVHLAGWEPIQARGAELGLELAATERPDAILLDVMMPDIDGPSTLARLRSSHGTSAIPVVFITAKVDAGTHRILRELGAAGVIEKPFDTGSLTRQIAEKVGWAS